MVSTLFQQLVGEGLIARTTTALVVCPIDLDQARQAGFLRLSPELEVAKRLALAGARNLDLLAALLEMQRTSMEANDVDGLARAEQLFTRQLYDAAGVGPLWDDTGAGRSQFDRIMRQQLGVRVKAEGSIGRQHALLEAIAQRDLGGACAAVRARLELLLSGIGLLRARQPAWFQQDHVPAERSRSCAANHSTDQRSELKY